MDMDTIIEELINIRQWVDKWVEEVKEAEKNKESIAKQKTK